MSERLDSETENVIEEFRGRAVLYDRCNCPKPECLHWRKKERAYDALRDRIRALISEARNA
jgi:hypothetical protein